MGVTVVTGNLKYLWSVGRYMISLKQFGIATVVGILFALPSLSTYATDPFGAIGGALAGLLIGMFLTGVVAVPYNFVNSRRSPTPDQQAS